MNNNERLFTKMTNGNFQDSLSGRELNIRDIHVSQVLDANKILGTLKTSTTVVNKTIVNQATVVAQVNNSGHSTGAVIGAGVAGAALGAGLGYLMSNHDSEESDSSAADQYDGSDDSDSSYDSGDSGDSGSGDDE